MAAVAFVKKGATATSPICSRVRFIWPLMALLAVLSIVFLVIGVLVRRA
jgi:hypothetical protein